MMPFGILNKDIEYIKSQIKSFPEIEGAIIFGSRAMGNYKPFSDIDLCIKGKNINFDTVTNLKERLQERGPLPYIFDIIHYENIKSKELKNHIDQFGKLLK